MQQHTNARAQQVNPGELGCACLLLIAADGCQWSQQVLKVELSQAVLDAYVLRICCRRLVALRDIFGTARLFALLSGGRSLRLPNSHLERKEQLLHRWLSALL